MFIDITPLISVETNNIEAIEMIDQLNCLVHTNSRSFRVDMPKDVLVSLIKSRTEKPKEPMSNVENLLAQILQGQQSQKV